MDGLGEVVVDGQVSIIYSTYGEEKPSHVPYGGLNEVCFRLQPVPLFSYCGAVLCCQLVKHNYGFLVHCRLTASMAGLLNDWTGLHWTLQLALTTND